MHEHADLIAPSSRATDTSSGAGSSSAFIWCRASGLIVVVSPEAHRERGEHVMDGVVHPLDVAVEVEVLHVARERLDRLLPGDAGQGGSEAVVDAPDRRRRAGWASA